MNNIVEVVPRGARGHQGTCTCGWEGKVRRRFVAFAVHDAHMHCATNPGHCPAVPLLAGAS